MTVFAARTTSFFFSRKPGNLLLSAALVANLVTTFFAAYWFLNVSSTSSGNIPTMHPISWRLVGFVWGYNLIWFLIQDVVKVLELRGIAKYNEIKGHKDAFTGQILTDSFLVFSTGQGRGARGSIVTRLSVAAARATMAK